MAVLEALPEALALAFTPRGLLFIAIGTLYGFVLGILPGVSGSMGLVLLVPVTMGWPVEEALLILAATWGANAFAGSVVAITLGVPGDAVNAMTVFDGYPMARRGRGVEAIAASGMASALGATVGIFFLLAMIPVLRETVLLFGPAEFFALGMIGVVVIATVSGGAVEKGMLSGALGLLFGLHGTNVITGASRYDFGLLYLMDGIPLVPVFIGVFAFGHAIHLYLHEGTVTGEAALMHNSLRQVWSGIRAVFQNFGVFVRSCLIAIGIGAIPGPGATLATFIAYGQAAKTAKPPRNFGKGDVRGVIGVEAATDAKDGASLIPTAAFGVPGTISAGIMLLGMRMHGVRPGPPLLNEELSILLVILLGLLVSNWLSSLLGVSLSSQITRITSMPTTIIAPAVLVFAVIGGLAARGRIGDVVMVVLMGLIGYVFRRANIPVIPMVIALLLAELLETSFHQAYQIGEESLVLFYTRPIAATLLATSIVIGLWPVTLGPWLRVRRTRRQQQPAP